MCWNRQTGTFEGRVSIDVWVQVPLLAPISLAAVKLNRWTGEFYEKITCGGTYTKIREQMIMKVSSDRDIYPELSGFPQAEQNMIRTFLAESLLAMYRTWIMDGKKIPVQRAIEITSEALIHGVKNYMK